MQAEPGKTMTIPETREGQLVGSNDSETGKRDRQRVPVKQRDAEQCQGEKNEIERNSEDQNGFSQFGLVVPSLAGYRRSCRLDRCRQDNTDPNHPLLRDVCETLSRVRFI